MLYAINYDLKKPGRNYAGLYEAIKSVGPWWHYLGSTWLVDTDLSAGEIWDQLKRYVDQNDRLLVIGVTKESQGWLPKEAWDWIKSRRARAAA